MSDFNPLNHTMKITGGEDYLPPKYALEWFHDEHPIPSGRVLTTVLSQEPPMFRAEVWIDDTLVATGHATPEGKTNTFRKIETAAVRRALANAGYDAGTAKRKFMKATINTQQSANALSNGGNRRVGNVPVQSKPPAEPPAPPQPDPIDDTAQELGGQATNPFFANRKPKAESSAGDWLHVTKIQRLTTSAPGGYGARLHTDAGKFEIEDAADLPADVPFHTFETVNRIWDLHTVGWKLYITIKDDNGAQLVDQMRFEPFVAEKAG